MRAVIVAIGVLCAGSAWARVGGGEAGEALTVKLSWNDGGELRDAWLDPRAILEFEADEAGARAVKSIDPAASGTKSGQARVWRLASMEGREAIARLSKTMPKGRFVPVYRDAPSVGSRARALTGELVVTVSSDVANPRKMLGERLLLVVRSLPSSPNSFLVRPPAAVDPIKLASRLTGSRGVVSAVPNWWLEGAAK